MASALKSESPEIFERAELRGDGAVVHDGVASVVSARPRIQ
jgi:hypothetical protein